MFLIIFFGIYKNEWDQLIKFSLLSKKQNVILNKAKDYYKNNKERLNTETYLKKKKENEREYWKNRYHNMSEEKKQKLKEYQKNYCRTKESQHNNE